MKLLVTGGSGFIGSALIRYILNNTYDEVINIDCLTYATTKWQHNYATFKERYFFEQINITNLEDLVKTFKFHKPDKVIHLAAESHVDRSISGPAEFLNTNVHGTFNLLEASRQYYSGLKISQKSKFTFHHVSTDEVFGDLGLEKSSQCQLFNETSPYAPSSPYSASKAASDHFVRAWGRTYKLPFIITNCSNNYGPFQYPEKLIPMIINNALKGINIPVYGNGLQIRDWLYVDDHVAGLYLASCKGKIGETYCIGGDSELTNIDVITKVLEKLDTLCPSRNSYKNLITYVEDRSGHDQRYAIDASKIKKDLQWNPKETFDTGIEKTIKWYHSYFQKK